MAGLTSNNSFSASLLPSALRIFTSEAVRDVPPPRGKSISSVLREEINFGASSGANFLVSDSRDFFALGAEVVSDEERFRAGIGGTVEIQKSVGSRSPTKSSNENR